MHEQEDAGGEAMTQRGDAGRRETILAIDDSLLVGKLIERTFAGEPVEVLLTGSAEEGLRLAEESSPDIILLDVILPHADGFDVCRRLKANRATAEIPIIFITARGDQDSVVDGFRLGAVDYIAKPFHPVELKARVRSHLDNHRMKNTLHKVNQILEKALNENRRLIGTDALTGVSNRRWFMQRLEQLIAQGTPFSAAFGDIDDFKKINDTYGHMAGDYVLASVARVIGGALAPGDSVSRWGGEEFAVLMPGTDSGEALLRVEGARIRLAENCLRYNEWEIRCTMTFGVGAFRPGMTADRMMERLDRALYDGKRRGKNRCVFAGDATPEG